MTPQDPTPRPSGADLVETSAQAGLERLGPEDQWVVTQFQQHYQPPRLESWEARRFLDGLEARRVASMQNDGWVRRLALAGVPLVMALVLVVAFWQGKPMPVQLPVARQEGLPGSPVEPSRDTLRLAAPEPLPAVAAEAPGADTILAMATDVEGILGEDSEDSDADTSEGDAGAGVSGENPDGAAASALALVVSDELLQPESENTWLPDDYLALDITLPEQPSRAL